MGVKKFFERCCGVDFGPHSFKSGIPKVLVPGCALTFVAIFFMVIGILLCVLHAVYKVSRVDDTYEDYFLISGVIAIVLAVIIALVATAWCLHVRKNLAPEMDYYRETKLSRSASMRSNISQGEVAAISNPKSDVPQDWRYQPQKSYEPQPLHYPEKEPEPSYPTYPENREPQGGFSDLPTEVYDPVTDSYVPRGSYHHGEEMVPLPQRGVNPDAVTRLNNKVNNGVKGFQGFVQRNREHSKNGTSPRRSKVPYSERMKDFQGIGVPEDGEGQFNLASTYNAPEPRYYTNNHPTGNPYPPQGPENEGGYANIPDTYNAHLPRAQRPASASQAIGEGAPKDAKPKKRVQSENVAPKEYLPHPDANPDPYKYVDGRPLDSSIDSTGEKTTLVYDPKDGRWYYYYKGKPVSEYTGDNPERDAHTGPVYRYINGKPVVVNNNDNLPGVEQQQGGKRSKRT